MIHRIVLVLFTVLSIATVFTGFPAEAQDVPASVGEMTATYTRQIFSLAGREEYREAIAKVSDYEEEILEQYPAPTYEMGLFQCQAEHLSFHCPFVDWKRVKEDPEKEDDLKKLAMLGWNFLLVLEGDSDEKGLLVFCLDIKRLFQRMGAQEEINNSSSDHILQWLSVMVGSQFGAAESQEFQTIGDHRVFCIRFKTGLSDPEKRMVLVSNNLQAYAFFLSSPPSEIAANEKRLEELIKTVGFKYRPEDGEAIDGARADVDRKDIKAMLKCVRDLAVLGEYNAAAEDLAAVRLMLYDQMPKVRVKDDTASFPAYGVTLENPDPKHWKLSSLQQGVSQMVVLEDNFSVQEEGILVGVIDLFVSYGPKALKLLNSPEIGKDSLIGMGRGSAMSLGEIDSEKIVPWKDTLAYEAVVTPNTTGVKARIRCVNMGDFGLLVLMIADARDFDAKIAEYDRILDNCLEIPKPKSESRDR